MHRETHFQFNVHSTSFIIVTEISAHNFFNLISQRVNAFNLK